MTHLVELVRREPDDYLVHDGLCTSPLPSWDAMKKRHKRGTRALTLKDEAVSQPVAGGCCRQRAGCLARGAGDKQAVIAFSLWGAQPRYLRGALDNVLAAAYLYPGWRVRFYVDGSVPQGFWPACRNMAPR